MDIDEDEVTREPFEDQNNDYDEAASVSSWQQPGYDSQLECRDDDDEDNDNKDGLDTTDATLIAQDSNDADDCSSVSAEDINYARSFGIQLKSSKSHAYYERLIHSDLFESTSVQQQSVVPKTGTHTEPTIKTSVTSDCTYHKGCFYQKGDIVALCDQDDGLIYFAQLTGFLQDQYCEKSASINWLVPTKPTSRSFFDPSAYRIGLEDVQLRKLDCMTFVCRCPHDYYLRKFFQADQPTTSDRFNGDANRRSLETSYRKSNRNQTYIWTTMRPCSVPTIETKTDEQ